MKRSKAKRKNRHPVPLIAGGAVALQRINAFLDSVIQNLPHMVFVKDARELRFVRFNKAGEDLLGFRAEDMMGKNDYDFFPKGEADFFTQKDREVLKSGRMFDIPAEPIHTKKRGIRILHTKKIPILDENGQAVYLLGISEDITDRLRMEKEISAISDREQRRLGQDLHDGIGQQLTGIAFLIKGLAQKLKANQRPEADDAAKIADLVNESIGKTRNIARILNPIDLESGGLPSALRDLAASTQGLYGVRCEISKNVPLEFSDSSVPVHLFRIVQEAVDNAVKHGHPTRIQVEFEKSDQQFVMKIVDDGTGLPESLEKRRGMGISNMMYRAEAIGGSLSIERGKDKGVVVTCTFSGRLN